MMPRFLVLGLWWRSKSREVRGAADAAKSDHEAFLIGSKDKTEAAPRTWAGFCLLGGGHGVPCPSHPRLFLQESGNPCKH